jgi:hypothetical protein
MKNIYIEIQWTSSSFIEDAKENFKYAKAYKYLTWYNQKNNDYIKLFKDINIDYIDEIDKNKFIILNIDSRGYSQDEWQEFNLIFKKDIEKDIEAMEELNYFIQDLKYYFTAQDFIFKWYIENKKEIDWKEYINKESLIATHITKEDWFLNDEDINYFIEENNLKKEDYNFIYNINNINYN